MEVDSPNKRMRGECGPSSSGASSSANLKEVIRTFAFETLNAKIRSEVVPETARRLVDLLLFEGVKLPTEFDSYTRAEISAQNAVAIVAATSLGLSTTNAVDVIENLFQVSHELPADANIPEEIAAVAQDTSYMALRYTWLNRAFNVNGIEGVQHVLRYYIQEEPF